jgi:hypothetical protein
VRQRRGVRRGSREAERATKRCATFSTAVKSLPHGIRLRLEVRKCDLRRAEIGEWSTASIGSALGCESISNAIRQARLSNMPKTTSRDAQHCSQPIPNLAGSSCQIKAFGKRRRHRYDFCSDRNKQHPCCKGRPYAFHQPQSSLSSLNEASQFGFCILR